MIIFAFSSLSSIKVSVFCSLLHKFQIAVSKTFTKCVLQIYGLTSADYNVIAKLLLYSLCKMSAL